MELKGCRVGWPGAPIQLARLRPLPSCAAFLLLAAALVAPNMGAAAAPSGGAQGRLPVWMSPRKFAKPASCPAPPGGTCGKVMVPLNWRRPSGPKTGISYIRFRHTDRSHPQLGTIFATEGGPGFSASSIPDAYQFV